MEAICKLDAAYHTILQGTLSASKSSSRDFGQFIFGETIIAAHLCKTYSNLECLESQERLLQIAYIDCVKGRPARYQKDLVPF